MTPWSMAHEGSFDFEVETTAGNASKTDAMAALPLSKASLFFAQNKSACGALSRVPARGGNAGVKGGTSDVEGRVQNGEQPKKTVERSTSCSVLPPIAQTLQRDLSAAMDFLGMNAAGKMQDSCLNSGKRWRQRRPPPVKVPKPDIRDLAGFYSEAFAAGTPGRLKEPLQDVLGKLTSEELDCTLAVWDSSRRNLHDAENFQALFEKVGAVDWIHACCPRIAPGFVLVKTKSAVTSEKLLSAFGSPQLDGATMSVQHVRRFARDVGIDLTN
eukprot:TRINITY_DN13780_c0_g2_i1.p1 TRINITY_DN13780_c0_g2~~TRINITY_DN13780_c0_g2_i1.p1  ORF type:complete len:271 (+),score=42.59 TRINITY_DN13780_c0_g2_i1:68-880(+)